MVLKGKQTVTTPNSAKSRRPTLPPLWTYYRVQWMFEHTKLCASVPADEAMIGKWLAARQPRVKPAGAKSIEEINEEVLASVERGEGMPDQEFGFLVFQRDAGQLVMRAGTVRSHIKDCARILSAQYVGKIEGERSFSHRVINGVYYDETVYWVPIRRSDGRNLTEPDGEYDKPVHAWGPKGRIDALKRIEYVAPPAMLEFTLKILGQSVSEADLHYIFQYGGTHGYAGERGDGEGKYRYTLTRLPAQG